jgi:inhibitor of KinA
MPEPRAHPIGDTALLLQLGSRIDTALNAHCHALAAALRKRPGVRDAVAGYATVTVHFDPEKTNANTLRAAAGRILGAKPRVGPSGRLHRIPVRYEGPDLAAAAAELGIDVARLVDLHTRPIYRVFTIGFCPGFAYLGPLPAALQLPRRRVPRTQVPAGSVAIAGEQTGVYPLPTPGGWHLIGLTEVRMFLPESDPPSLLRPGDRVKFAAL